MPLKTSGLLLAFIYISDNSYISLLTIPSANCEYKILSFNSYCFQVDDLCVAVCSFNGVLGLGFQVDSLHRFLSLFVIAKRTSVSNLAKMYSKGIG